MEKGFLGNVCPINKMSYLTKNFHTKKPCLPNFDTWRLELFLMLGYSPWSWANLRGSRTSCTWYPPKTTRVSSTLDMTTSDLRWDIDVTEDHRPEKKLGTVNTRISKRWWAYLDILTEGTCCGRHEKSHNEESTNKKSTNEKSPKNWKSWFSGALTHLGAWK